MIEPTDEEVAAFTEGWEAERKRIGRGIAPAGSKTRAGLRAVYSLMAAIPGTVEELGEKHASAVHRPSDPWDMAKAVGAVADFMGVPPYRVPDKVTAHDGVPWSMYSALEIAYKAGKEARHD